MNKPANFALESARKQKRLKYWEEKFSKSNMSSEIGGMGLKNMLETYRLLISKLVKAPDEQTFQETLGRVSSTERELASLFESLRLMTSEIGVAAVE